VVAEEVLLNSGEWYGSSPAHERGRNSSFDSQGRNEGPQHQARGPYACKICPNRFYNKQHELNRHMKKHTKPFACSSGGCGRRYPERKDLDRHVQAYHCSEKHSFKCEGCGRGFTRQDNLTRHRRKRHV
ncbi:hypothetical protein LX36DRAFT_578995, partial [Colletotrichum falcatum]